QRWRNSRVFDSQARQLCKIRTCLGIKPGADCVYYANATCTLRPRFEQLFFSGANGAFSQLSLHNYQTICDLSLVCCRTITAKQKLDDVCRDRILTFVFSD